MGMVVEKLKVTNSKDPSKSRDRTRHRYWCTHVRSANGFNPKAWLGGD